MSIILSPTLFGTHFQLQNFACTKATRNFTGPVTDATTIPFLKLPVSMETTIRLTNHNAAKSEKFLQKHFMAFFQKGKSLHQHHYNHANKKLFLTKKITKNTTSDERNNQ
jgi:hypothetical protein